MTSAQHPALAALRAVGIACLGLIGGVLLGVVVQDVLAVLLVTAGAGPTVLGMVFGGLLPVLAVAGAVLAVWLDRRARRRRREGTGQER